MAVVRTIGVLSNKLLRNNIPLIYSTRSVTDDKEYKKYWDSVKPYGIRDMMPGWFPETEEERLKAAEKYGLHPHDYKPYPNDHRHQGDYPDLPWIGVEARDPYYPWDYPSLRRNFEDPVHLNQDIMGDDRYDYGVRKLISDGKGALMFLGTIGLLLLMHELTSQTSIPRMEKQYSRDGVHYTFEPAN